MVAATWKVRPTPRRQTSCGAKPASDPVIRNSLVVGDKMLKVQTPNGPVWHRFTFDGYGETATGADWDIFPTKANQTFGRGWPILTGERGEYETARGGDARPLLDAML